MNQAKEMARIAYEALSEKKGEDIKVIDISGISVLADYFLIAHGNSDSQVNALVENVEEQLHKAGYPLKEREGQASGKWVLMDFGDSIEKTVSSIISKESGRMEKKFPQKNYKLF